MNDSIKFYFAVLINLYIQTRLRFGSPLPLILTCNSLYLAVVREICRSFGEIQQQQTVTYLCRSFHCATSETFFSFQGI